MEKFRSFADHCSYNLLVSLLKFGNRQTDRQNNQLIVVYSHVIAVRIRLQ